MIILFIIIFEIQPTVGTTATPTSGQETPLSAIIANVLETTLVTLIDDIDPTSIQINSKFSAVTTPTLLYKLTPSIHFVVSTVYKN